MFTWIPIYKEIASKLLDYKDRQKDLINILRSLSEKGISSIKLKDENPKKINIPLGEIDPFSFFSYFNRRIREDERIKILKNLKGYLDLNTIIPEDFSGIPIVNNQNSLFFAWKYERKEDDIIHSVINNAV